MTNPLEPGRRPATRRLLPIIAARPARALARALASVAAWARLANGSLRLGGADAEVSLDPASRGLLWHLLVETIAAIGALAMTDGTVAEALAVLRALADGARRALAATPPRAAALPGAEAPQLFVLEMLSHDLQPCLGRWQPRLAAWAAAGRREVDWPLRRRCRDDLARTRARLVERAWQLGFALGLRGLERLLPQRPAAVPVLASPEDLTADAAAAGAGADAGLLPAGWRIYVEAATRVRARPPPPGPGVLGEAIAALDALAGEIRAELKAMPPPLPKGGVAQGGADPIRALALGLLNDGVEPFLAEWRPRWRRFAASARSENKWSRAEACRAALTAALERCRPTIRALGREIGAPPLPEPSDRAVLAADETPLQLPAPGATLP